MAISTKNKRKFTFQNQPYYWWIKEEFDGLGGMLQVNIASLDKSFLVQYYAVQQDDSKYYLNVIGRNFPGLASKIGNHTKLTCPNLIPELNKSEISPKHIENILYWCFNIDKEN